MKVTDWKDGEALSLCYFKINFKLLMKIANQRYGEALDTLSPIKRLHVNFRKKQK